MEQQVLTTTTTTTTTTNFEATSGDDDVNENHTSDCKAGVDNAVLVVDSLGHLNEESNTRNSYDDDDDVDDETSTTCRWKKLADRCLIAYRQFKLWDATTPVSDDIIKKLCTATPNCRCPLCGLKADVWRYAEAARFLSLQTIPELPSPETDFDLFSSSSQGIATSGSNCAELKTEEAPCQPEEAPCQPEEAPCKPEEAAWKAIIAKLLAEKAASDAKIAASEAENANLRVEIAASKIAALKASIAALQTASKAKIALLSAFEVATIVTAISTAHHDKNQILHTLADHFRNGTGNMESQSYSCSATVDLNRFDVRNPTSPSDVNVVIGALDDSETRKRTTQEVIAKSPRKKPKEDNEEKKSKAMDNTNEPQFDVNVSSAKLALFHSILEKLFSKGTVPPSQTDSPHSIQDMEALIYKWEDLKPADDDCFCTPSNVGREVDGSHALLLAILFELTIITQKDFWVMHEQRTVNGYFSTVQEVDLVDNRVAEHVNAAFAFMHVVPIEIKSVGRKSQSFASILDGGRCQVVGHLARKLQHYFHFWGIGINRKCRGAVITSVSISIVELELSGVGTEFVKVKVDQTKTFSLFGYETTCKLLRNKKASLDLISFDTVDGLPKGFRLLTQMLNWPNEESGFNLDDEKITYIDETQKERKVNINKASYLGEGSFGFVYKASDDSIVKMPKSFRTVPSLKREAATLQRLDHANIPKVIDEKQLTLTTNLETRCGSVQFPSLWLRGHVGKAASKLFLAPDEIAEVYECVKAALKYAHEKEYVHLDVCPSNIVVLRNSDGPVAVQLIDWGCAARKLDMRRGFCGSPPYAHDEICLTLKDNNRTWNAMPEHDMASLAYTVAVLVRQPSEFHVPWDGFYGEEVDDTVLSERRRLALDLINASGLLDEIKTELENAIKKEELTVDDARSE